MKNMLLSMVAVAVAWAAHVSGAEIVRLKVTEPAGVARAAEPVTSGVPFPQGAVKDVRQLVLLGPNGNPVPADFTATCLWPKDKSVRWALLDTQLTVPANGTLDLAVASAAAPAPAVKLTIEETPDLFTVNTGVLKFTVRRKGFRLFESASLDATRPLLAAHAEGLAMTVKGQRYTSAGDMSGTVVVEEQNDMRLCLLAKGKLAGPGPDGYSYEVRIHAYAGSPLVKVVPTVIKTFGKRRDITQNFTDLSLGLKLAASSGLQYALGGEAAPAAGPLAAGQTASVLVKSSDEWVFGGAASGSGRCKSTKPLTLGWGDLAGANGGVAVGVYRFWQVFPKSIELGGDGTIGVGLFPKLLGKPQEFYTGMARTHEVLVAFHAPTTPAEVQKRFVALQKPLFAAAPSDWYCRSGVFGPLAPTGTDVPAVTAAAFKHAEGQIVSGIDTLATVRQDDYRRNDVRMDAYGFLAYGDTIHYTWDNEPLGSPWKIAWDGNYYDLPLLACHAFARTGERRFLEFFADHSWHLMDVDVIFWDDMPEQARGGSRRCPATNHVGFDPPNHKEPVHNASFDHHKSESLFARYYLLGDRRALTAAQDLLWWADNTTRDGTLGNRCSAHQTLTLVAGYWATGDEKYLARAKKIVYGNMALQDKFNGGFTPKLEFYIGILAESMAKYYWATGDETVFKALQRFADWTIDTKQESFAASNCAFVHALVYSKTKDEKYLKAAAYYMGKGSSGNLGKDLAMSYRSVPYAGAILAGRGE